MAMVSDLRKRCPWDRVQTRETLRPYLVEEVLELDHALAVGDPGAIRDEVADLLLHLAWQLVLAEELDEFTAEDVAGDLERKMQRRHPHLFELGPREPWEQLKRREFGDPPQGTLEGLPPTLPSLQMSLRLQERAASVGFDWPDLRGPLEKVKEETAELEDEMARADPDRERLTHEVGDLLTSVVNLARKLGIHPGSALDQANRRFRSRFAAVERLAEERGEELHALGLTALDSLWEEAKREET
jgi:MazG family protein